MRQIDRDAYRDWGGFKENIYRETPVDKSMSPAEIDRHRQYLEAHPLEWIRFFFPGYARYEFAPFHKRAVSRILVNPEWYEVLSWSRELAKSTVVMFIISYLVLTGKKKNILLISNSLDNARRLLDPYRGNFEANRRIEAYYGKQQTLGSWSDSEFILKCGASFRALGAGQSPRGTRNEAARPDVLVFDDFDTDEDCLNPDTINKKWDWVERSAYPTRSISEPFLVLWCGNIIAKDCCVVRAGKAADHWDIVNIRDKEGHSTWPEKNTEEHIDRTLSKISTKSAQGEYFNNPISEGEVFKTVTYGKVPPLGRFKYLVVYGDPSNSENKTKRNSTKAVILLGKLQGKLYVIGCRLDRASSAEFVQWYADMLAMAGDRSNVYCYMENNSLQDPFFQQVFQPKVRELRKRLGIDLYIRGDEEKKTDKATRIEANLEPMSREGNLVLNEALRDDPHMKRLEEQFLLFTMRLKFPADGPDCVEGGNRILNRLQASLEPTIVITAKEERKKNKYRL